MKRWRSDYLTDWENQQDEKQFGTTPAQTIPPTLRPMAMPLSVPAKPTGDRGRPYTLDAHRRAQGDDNQKQLPEYQSAQKTIQKALEQFLSPKYAAEAAKHVLLALGLHDVPRTQ